MARRGRRGPLNCRASVHRRDAERLAVEDVSRAYGPVMDEGDSAVALGLAGIARFGGP